MGVPGLALETCAQPLRVPVKADTTAINQKGLDAKSFIIIFLVQS
jgi:hypothetical protein